MRDIVVTLVAFAALVWALRSPLNAMLTYWWFAIFRPHDWIYSSLLSDLRVPLLATLIFFLGAAAKGIHPFGRDAKNIVPALLLVIILAIGTLLAGCSDSLVRIYSMTEVTVLFYACFLTAKVVKTKRDFFSLYALLAACISFHAGKEGLIALASGSHKAAYGTMSGLFTGSNAYALGSGMLLFTIIFIAQNLRKSQKSTSLPRAFNILRRSSAARKTTLLACGLLALGVLYNVVSLESRGSFLATMGAISVWLTINIGSTRALILGTVAGVLISVLYQPPEGYVDRIQSAFAESDELDASATSRLYFWQIARSMANSNPFGVGAGCYASYYNAYDESGGLHGTFRSVHSSHFQILAESGYLGLAVWITMFIRSLFQQVRVCRAARNGDQLPVGDSLFYISASSALMGTLLVFIVGGAFYELAYNDLAWLIVALTGSVSKMYHQDQEPTHQGTLRNSKHVSLTS
ncbi:MAG: O-antigen ligase family protein [Pseudomonadota bacterium]